MPFDIAARIEAWRAQLLDTTKRNRLISFKSGRGGGILLVHPDPGELWHRLVAGNRPLTFPWKRDLIDLPVDTEEVTNGTANALTLFEPEEASAAAGSQDVVERCRHSPRLDSDHLLTEFPDKRLAARLTRLALNAHESLTEQGVTTLYAAF